MSAWFRIRATNKVDDSPMVTGALVVFAGLFLWFILRACKGSGE